MNLHRIVGKAEWTGVPEAKRNIWQKIAVRTHGIVTIGNLFSIVGLASVPYGLWLILGHASYLSGIGVLLAGRACDLLDGWLADRTHTKSPLGEKLDATFDKLSVGVTIVALAAGQVISWVVLVILLTPHFVIAILALAAFLQGRQLHPSLEGKISMAIAWFCLLAFTALHSFHFMVSQWTTVALTAMAAYGLLFVSVVLGLMATYGYIEEFNEPQAKHSKS